MKTILKNHIAEARKALTLDPTWLDNAAMEAWIKGQGYAVSAFKAAVAEGGMPKPKATAMPKPKDTAKVGYHIIQFDDGGSAGAIRSVDGFARKGNYASASHRRKIAEAMEADGCGTDFAKWMKHCDKIDAAAE